MKRSTVSPRMRWLRRWRTVCAYWSWWYVAGAVLLGLLAIVLNLVVRGPL